MMFPWQKTDQKSHPTFKYFSLSKDGRSYFFKSFYTDFIKRGNVPYIYSSSFSFLVVILFFSSLWHTNMFNSPQRKKRGEGRKEGRKREGERREKGR